MSEEVKQDDHGSKAKAQPSAPASESSGTAGTKSNEQVINPSAPGETGTTVKDAESRN